jgi:hypothetical protein
MEMVQTQNVRMQYDSEAIKGKCAACGTGMYVIVKQGKRPNIKGWVMFWIIVIGIGFVWLAALFPFLWIVYVILFAFFMLIRKISNSS